MKVLRRKIELDLLLDADRVASYHGLDAEFRWGLSPAGINLHVEVLNEIWSKFGSAWIKTSDQ